MVGDDAVDLFRHGAVAASQAGLDVGDRLQELGGDERGRNGGVDIAVDQHPVGRVGFDDRLDALHNLGGLGGVGPGTDAEVRVGSRQVELVEEDARHLLVIVLAGVYELLFGSAGRESAVDRSRFHEIGACSDDVKNPHQFVP
jgi:hypothetical protein